MKNDLLYFIISVLVVLFLFIPLFLQKKNFFKEVYLSLGLIYYDVVELVLGPDLAKKHFRFFFILFIFIFVSNILGLVPFFHPITQNINFTVGLALIVFFYYHAQGIKEVGWKDYAKHFTGPFWIMAFFFLPLEILSHGIRPISLGLRLRTNIYADHEIYKAFLNLIPYFVPVIFLFQGLFISLVQAFIFTLLGLVYIKLATTHEE